MQRQEFSQLVPVNWTFASCPSGDLVGSIIFSSLHFQPLRIRHTERTEWSVWLNISWTTYWTDVWRNKEIHLKQISARYNEGIRSVCPSQLKTKTQPGQLFPSPWRFDELVWTIPRSLSLFTQFQIARSIMTHDRLIKIWLRSTCRWDVDTVVPAAAGIPTLPWRKNQSTR